MNILPGLKISQMVLEIIGKQAKGAWPNGARVRKLLTVEGEGHEPGAMATVRGSVGPVQPEGHPASMLYVVEWDDMPGVPVLCTERSLKGKRLELVDIDGAVQ